MELTDENVLREGDLIAVHSDGTTTHFVVVRAGGRLRMESMAAEEFESRRSDATSSEPH